MSYPHQCSEQPTLKSLRVDVDEIKRDVAGMKAWQEEHDEKHMLFAKDVTDIKNQIGHANAFNLDESTGLVGLVIKLQGSVSKALNRLDDVEEETEISKVQNLDELRRRARKAEAEVRGVRKEEAERRKILFKTLMQIVAAAVAGGAGIKILDNLSWIGKLLP